MFSCKRLKYASHEPVRKEEASQPVSFRMTILHPVPNEVDSHIKVLEPRSQIIQRCVSNFFPIQRNLILQKALVHVVQGCTHDFKSLNSSHQCLERRLNDVYKSVIPLLLLQENDTVAVEKALLVSLEYFYRMLGWIDSLRSLFVELIGQLINCIVIFLQCRWWFLLIFRCAFWSLIICFLPILTHFGRLDIALSSILRYYWYGLYIQYGAYHFARLILLESNLCILMHAKYLWGIICWQLVHVLLDIAVTLMLFWYVINRILEKCEFIWNL